MKRFLMIALLISAIPAVAVGQDVSCETCTHYVSVYQGEGGFIATAEGDAEMVTFVATCEGVTRSGELMPDDDGMVSMLLTGDYACHGTNEKNQFRVGPIMDGGWYWITMEDNSAVGGLVNEDVLGNAATDPTSAGDGVMMVDQEKGAVLLTETATGRVGILPTILPVPTVEPEMATPCGYTGTATANYKRLDSNCAMGDGGTITLANYTNSITGATTRVMDGDTVTRPGGSGTLTVMIDLWGNGSGHFITNAAATGDEIVRGQPDVSGSTRDARYTGITYTGTLGSGPGSADLDTGTSVLDTSTTGIVLDTTTTTDLAMVLIEHNDSYCGATANHSATVSISAAMTDAAAILVTPSVERSGTGVAGGISFNVVCPAASSNQGVELVPENPFPVE